MFKSKGYAGDTGGIHVYIHSQLHRLGVHTVNHLSVVCGVNCMTHGYGHLQVLGTGGGYNEGRYINLITSLNTKHCS